MCDATTEIILTLIFVMSAASYHCMKSVRIRSFSGSYFLAFGLNTGNAGCWKMHENKDQKNSEYGHCSRSMHLKFYYHQELATLLIALIKHLVSQARGISEFGIE